MDEFNPEYARERLRDIVRQVREKYAKIDIWAPYGRERWQAGLKPHGINCPDFCGKCKPQKPFLTAADIILLREMKISL